MKPDLSPALNRFLRRVNRKLDLPKDLRKRILSDLQVALADRLDAGDSEEEILREFDSPAKVAEEFNAQMQEFAYQKKPLRFVFLGLAILGIVLLLSDILITLLVHDFLGSHAGGIGIIGGADGPTSIFVTTTVRGSMAWDLVCYAILAAVGLLGYRYFRNRRKKQEDDHA